jgi:hypothetical protein
MNERVESKKVRKKERKKARGKRIKVPKSREGLCPIILAQFKV